MWVEVVPAIALAIALAATAGLRAWLPLLVVGSLGRLGWLDLGAHFQFLGSNQALILFGLATVIEIAGDKFPAIDHALDAIHTVLRPASGSVLAASALAFVDDPLTALAAGIAIGAPTALLPHAAKATLRGVATALTGGLASPFLSLLEDILTVVLLVLAVLVPILTAVLLALFAFFVLRRFVRSQPTPPPAPASPRAV